jgi:hypothetical protein
MEAIPTLMEEMDVNRIDVGDVTVCGETFRFCINPCGPEARCV